MGIPAPSLTQSGARRRAQSLPKDMRFAAAKRSYPSLSPCSCRSWADEDPSDISLDESPCDSIMEEADGSSISEADTDTSVQKSVEDAWNKGWKSWRYNSKSYG